jgi:uncharacterized protein with gpF-like domain
MTRDADIKAGRVPPEVLKFWRDKSLELAFDWRDVWKEEHEFAFTAAKIMRDDVLEVLQAELGKALESGQSFESWAGDIEPKLQALGWWEPHDVHDPATGSRVRVNPPRRLKTIFNTNMRMAHAVGQYDRIQRTKRARPYLLYFVGPSARHRPQHLAWHGVLLPVDDEFWSYAFPPNGWGCKCGVRSVTQREAGELEEKGVLAPEASPELDAEGRPTGHVLDMRVPVQRVAPVLDLRAYKNERTGKVDFVPSGIDPGFHYAPGEARRRALGL